MEENEVSSFKFCARSFRFPIRRVEKGEKCYCMTVFLNLSEVSRLENRTGRLMLVCPFLK